MEPVKLPGSPWPPARCWVAADLLAKAEHDVLAPAILFTPLLILANAVQAEVARRLEDQPRVEILARAEGLKAPVRPAYERVSG